MQAAKFRKLIEDAAEKGAAKALCNQCVFTQEGVGILRTVIQVGIKFKGYIIVGLAIGLLALSFSGIGIAVILFRGGIF